MGLRSIIEDIRQIATFDPGIRFQFTSRFNNCVAHELARFCLRVSSGGVVNDGVHPCVVFLVSGWCRRPIW